MKANAKFSERLRDTLRRKGYWDADRAAPEVGRFCVDYGYLPSYLYRWLRGEVPRAEKLLILARQLQVEPEWLVGVEEPVRRRHPIAGGSGDGGTLPLADLDAVISLVRHWLRRMLARWAPALQPSWVAA